MQFVDETPTRLLRFTRKLPSPFQGEGFLAASSSCYALSGLTISSQSPLCGQPGKGSAVSRASPA